MNAKIRNAQLQKVPYMLVIGDRETEAGAAAVRLRSGDDLGAIPVDEIVVRGSPTRSRRRRSPLSVSLPRPTGERGVGI